MFALWNRHANLAFTCIQPTSDANSSQPATQSGKEFLSPFMGFEEAIFVESSLNLLRTGSAPYYANPCNINVIPTFIQRLQVLASAPLYVAASAQTDIRAFAPSPHRVLLLAIRVRRCFGRSNSAGSTEARRPDLLIRSAR